MTSKQKRVVVKVGSSSLTSLHGEISSKKTRKARRTDRPSEG